VTAICKRAAALKAGAGLLNVALSATKMHKRRVAPACKANGLRRAAPAANAGLSKMPINKRIAGPPPALGLANAGSSATQTCKPFAAPKPAAVWVNVASSKTATCKRLVGPK
jgi:hypothetical protein